MKATYNRLKYVFVLGATLALYSCEKTTVEQAAVEHQEQEVRMVGFTDVQIRTAGIQLGTVEQKQISGTIKVNGALDVPPQQMLSVSAPFGGFLKDTPLLQGSHVQKGQTIAVIENPDYIQFQQDYLEAKNQLEFAKTEFERQQQLATENVNSQKTLQQAKVNFENWQAKRNGLETKLNMLNIDIARLETGAITGTATIQAAISGFVTEVNVNMGKYVNPSDVLFKIVDTEHLHAELVIFEKDVPKVKIGQKVRFTLANETNERTATVYLIGREISADRTVRIHCHIDREDRNLLPGMYLKALIEAGGSQVTALPDEAIVDFEGKKFAFVPAAPPDGVEGSRYFEIVEIATGNSEFGYTEIFLPENWNRANQFVVKGAYTVLSKLKNGGESDHGH